MNQQNLTILEKMTAHSILIFRHPEQHSFFERELLADDLQAFHDELQRASKELASFEASLNNKNNNNNDNDSNASEEEKYHQRMWIEYERYHQRIYVEEIFDMKRRLEESCYWLIEILTSTCNLGDGNQAMWEDIERLNLDSIEDIERVLEKIGE